MYWAPEPSDPLWRAASAWLGRNAETGAAVQQPPVPGLAELTADARRYGFHATLKPPFKLATPYHDLLEDLHALARRLQPFELPPLELATLGGFLALRETAPCPALHALADACVVELDRHRAPPSEHELARRRAGGLGAAQEAMLTAWGYPYVLSTWFFHMTLTRRLSASEHAAVHPAAQSVFPAALLHSRTVNGFALFTQAGSDAPFLLAERVMFR